ncbi:VanZ family protein [Methylobacterium sp. JK268]
MSESFVMLRRACWAAGCLCVVVLVWLSLIPREWEVRTGVPGQAEHVAAYAGTAAFLVLGQRWPAAWRVAAGLAIVACLMEVGQIWVPGRTAQVIDAAASAAGAGLGALAGSFLRRRLLRRLA